MSAKVQVVFYSMYGHIYKMAEAVAEGARAAGADVELYRVAELVPDDVLEQFGAKKYAGKLRTCRSFSPTSLPKPTP